MQMGKEERGGGRLAGSRGRQALKIHPVARDRGGVFPTGSMPAHVQPIIIFQGPLNTKPIKYFTLLPGFRRFSSLKLVYRITIPTNFEASCAARKRESEKVRKAHEEGMRLVLASVSYVTCFVRQSPVPVTVKPVAF